MPAKSTRTHIRYPARAALVTFALLSAFMGVCMPFEPTVREAWPFALGYSGLLALWCIGFLRNGPRSQKLFFGALLLAFSPAVTGLGLLWTGSHLEIVMAWFGISLYLFYAVGVLGLCLAARGWYLYFSVDEQATAERDAYSRR